MERMNGLLGIEGERQTGLLEREREREKKTGLLMRDKERGSENGLLGIERETNWLARERKEETKRLAC